MKRFVIGAAAAAALALPAASAMPAGASAAEAPTGITAPAIPPCPTSNISYCVRYWISTLVAMDDDVCRIVYGEPCVAAITE